MIDLAAIKGRCNEANELRMHPQTWQDRIFGLAAAAFRDRTDLVTETERLLGRLAEREAQVADLHGLLEGVRTSLELASELLAPPGPMAAQAQRFIEEALEAVMEELD